MWATMWPNIMIRQCPGVPCSAREWVGVGTRCGSRGDVGFHHFLNPGGDLCVVLGAQPVDDPSLLGDAADSANLVHRREGVTVEIDSAHAVPGGLGIPARGEVHRGQRPAERVPTPVAHAGGDQEIGGGGASDRFPEVDRLCDLGLDLAHPELVPAIANPSGDATWRGRPGRAECKRGKPSGTVAIGEKKHSNLSRRGHQPAPRAAYAKRIYRHSGRAGGAPKAEAASNTSSIGAQCSDRSRPDIE